jgi:hypothetical protein
MTGHDGFPVLVNETLGIIMPTAEECRTYAAEYRRLRDEAADASPARAALLLNISRSWTALANQLDRLTAFLEEESKASMGGRRPETRIITGRPDQT